MTVGMLLDYARSGLGLAVAGVGALMMLGAAIGLLRFPDAFTRLHAGGATMSTAVSILLIGLLIVSESFMLAARLIFLLLLVIFSAPALSHIVGRAAHAAGITPVVGPYTAPRPGARSGK